MMTKRLSAESISSYQANGFLAPFPVINESQATTCRGQLEHFEAEHPEAQGKLDLKCNLLFPWLDGITRQSNLLDAAEDLLGPNLVCWNASIRQKEPHSQTCAGWHQDTPYIQGRRAGV